MLYANQDRPAQKFENNRELAGTLICTNNTNNCRASYIAKWRERQSYLEVFSASKKCMHEQRIDGTTKSVGTVPVGILSCETR